MSVALNDMSVALNDMSVVVVTRDRRQALERTLSRLAELAERPSVIVVDNGSTDGTPQAVRARFPDVNLLALEANHGSVARNLGVAAAGTELVAFSDDDSWWQPGSLRAAAEIFRHSPRVGLVAARVLVGPAQRLDPTCQAMAAGRLGVDQSGHRRVLGFLACGAVVRRDAFMEAGGFEELLFFFGEEETLALDMAAACWELVYAPEVVAVHSPEPGARDSSWRRRRQVRNRLLSAVIHHPWPAVVGKAARVLAAAGLDLRGVAGALEAVVLVPAALARRRTVPPWLGRRLAGLEQV